MLDELSLLLSPAVDGEVGSPSVFECSAGLWASAPKEFQLAEVQRLGESDFVLCTADGKTDFMPTPFGWNRTSLFIVPSRKD